MNEKAFDADVLIVGAGPTGVALACGLSRSGVSCLTIDKDLPAGQARAMGISARSLEVLRAYGLEADFLREGVIFRSMNIYLDRKVALSIPFNLTELSSPNPFSLVLPQDRVVALLEKRLEALGGRVTRPCKLKKLIQDDEGVTATLARVETEGSGDDGGNEGGYESASWDVRVRYVVGCDGAHSRVRSELGLEFEGSDYEDRLIAADVFVDWTLPDDSGHVFLGPSGTVTAFPFPEKGKWRLAVFGGNDLSDKSPEAVMRRLKKLMEESGPKGTVVRDPVHTTFYGIHRRSATRFRSGRCFVAGDAAHIHSPAGGQGMNTGIQDGFNLAWKVALVLNHKANDALLNSYHDERHPVAEQTLKSTNRLTQIIVPRNSFKLAMRNLMIKLLGGLNLAGQKLSHNLSQLEIKYDSSPIVYKESADHIGPRLKSVFHKTPDAGSRAPDAPCFSSNGLTSNRLFDFIYRDDILHTLLIFEGLQSKSQSESISRISNQIKTEFADRIKIFQIHRPGSRFDKSETKVHSIRDPDGSLHSKYGAIENAIFLIRPDGHIAFRGDSASADALLPYLRTLFGGRESL